MPLGMEVAFAQATVYQALPKKGAQQSPTFRPMAKRWMYLDATWYGGRPRPKQHVLDGDPQKGT